MYCKDCLLTKGEIISVQVHLAEDGDSMHSCEYCGGKNVDAVELVHLVKILWALSGHTPKQRELLQVYAEQYFNLQREE